MTSREIVRLVVFVLPLGLDTLALSTVLGMLPLPPRQRLRVALLFALAEGIMPAIRLLVDRVIVTGEEVEIRYVIPTTKNSEAVRFCHLRADYF